MDITHRFHFNSGLALLSRRIQALQIQLASKLPQTRKLDVKIPKAIRLSLAFTLMLLLGYWGTLTSRQEAQQSFEREHPPSVRAWEAGLTQLGFHQEKNPQKIQIAIRHLPSRLEGEESETWLSSDHQWIALLQASHPDEEPTVFCRSCSETPKSWTPEGQGWASFDRVLPLLEKEQGQNPIGHPSTRPQWRDPRELQD